MVMLSGDVECCQALLEAVRYDVRYFEMLLGGVLGIV